MSSAFKKSKIKTFADVTPLFESMESRLLFSVNLQSDLVHFDYELASITARTPKAAPASGYKNRLAKLPKLRSHTGSGVTPLVSRGSATPFGLTPAQIRGAYGVNSISLNGITGDGTGQTIAIIDAYDYPTAASDLAAFDAYFGLAAPPSFTKVNQSGGASLPGVQAGGNSLESALDVQWAHVMAPKASIILVECNDLQYADVFAGVQWVRNSSTASVVSMSFGGQESSGLASTYDSIFTSPSTAHQLTYVASTGDNGKYIVNSSDQVTATATNYPAVSPNVVGVGGTKLTVSGTSYSSESAWGNGTSSYLDSAHGGDGGGGGGISGVEAQPAYQSGVVSAFSTTARTLPDISLLADPVTGVPVYDSADYGVVSGTGGGWIPGTIGGTSLSAPLMSGLIAIANQGRVNNGMNTLDGPTQTLPALYNLSSADFHDITTGNNGYAAGVGYDLATGRGTPISNLLVPDLASAYSVSGNVFQDNNGNGTFDGTDSRISGQTVYLDLNNNSIKDSTDPSAVTTSTGQYVLGYPAGTGTKSVRLVSNPAGFVQVPTTTTFSQSNPLAQTVNLAFFPTVFSSASASANYTLQLDAAGTTEQILINNSLTYSVAKSVLGSSSLSFTLTGTGDSLTISGTNGNPIPAIGATGVFYTGAVGAGDTLTMIGTAGNDAFVVTSSSITFNTLPVSFSNVSLLTLNPGLGTDSLAVNSGSVTIAKQAAGLGILNRAFSSLTVAANASAIFATAPLHTDRMLVQTTTLSAAGKLDLGGNDLIVHNGNLTTVSSLLSSGYAGGSWAGPTGIQSSVAATDTTHLTALGVIANNLYGGSGQPLFDGVAPLTTDILVKYTYYGDTNLDGKVDGTDYSRIDNGYLFAVTGWANGDLNFDNKVDGSDYTLIDNTYNTQGSSL